MKKLKRIIAIGMVLCIAGSFQSVAAQVDLFNDYNGGNPNCTTGNCTASSSSNPGSTTNTTTTTNTTSGASTVPPRTTSTSTTTSSSGPDSTAVYCDDYDVPPFDCVPRPASSSGSTNAAPISCTTIATDAEYNACCTGMGPYPYACTYYTQSCANGVCTAPPGSVGGSAPATNAINGPASQWNVTYSGAGAPQASSSELAQCSAIRFLSLLDVLIWVKCIIVIGIIPLIFTLAFMFFLWGVLRFVYASDIKQKEESKKLIWYGLLGLFVMVSVWGIIKILGTTLGLDTSAVPLLQTSALDVKKANKK